MKNTKVTIKGKTSKIKKIKPANSYDIAYQLCHTLRLHKNLFCKDNDVIIYPSSWYDNFFELMFRDKNNSNANKIIDKHSLLEVLSKYLPDCWMMDYEEKYIKSDVLQLPLKIQFKYKNGEKL